MQYVFCIMNYEFLIMNYLVIAYLYINFTSRLFFLKKEYK